MSHNRSWLKSDSCSLGDQSRRMRYRYKSILFSLPALIGRCVAQLLTTRLNPLNAELNPICHLLALLGAHHILHVSGIRVKYLTSAFALLNAWHKEGIRGVSGAKQNIIYPACKEHAPCYIAICGLCGSTIFFQIIS